MLLDLFDFNARILKPIQMLELRWFNHDLATKLPTWQPYSAGASMRLETAGFPQQDFGGILKWIVYPLVIE
jgi:hypothetical protein